MRTVFRIGVASAVVMVSAGVPWLLYHNAQSNLLMKQKALGEQGGKLSFLAADNERLAGLLAKMTPSLNGDELRELLRLRNEKRLLAEQTNLLAGLLKQENQDHTRPAANTSNPAQLSPDEIVTALSAEMIVAMKRVLPALQPALKEYASDHDNQHPSNLSDLRKYFPIVAGQNMVGLRTFEFVREDGPKPGDVLLLSGNVGRRSADGRPGEGSEVRIYGFSDGRVVEVSSEDGRFDDWEKNHLNSPPAGAEEKIYLEAEGTARDRARIVELGASVGISAEDASRFFDRFKQEEKILGPRFAELRKHLTGSEEEQQRQIQAAAEQELTKLAIETLGDRGPALARKMLERK